MANMRFSVIINCS